MSILREDLEAGRVDFRDEVDPDAPPLPPLHPGAFLRIEFMEPLGLSINALARDLDVPPARIGEIVNGKRGVTADTALRLERYFGISARMWMGLQQDFELRNARRDLSARIEARVRRRDAAA